MGNALAALFSWQFLMFALGISVIVWIVRTITEYFWPKLDGNKLWEKLILPLYPIFLGALIAYFATGYPYPDGLISLSARIIFGSVAGMFSGLVYQVAKGMLKNTIQTYINSVVTTNTTVTTVTPNTPIVSPPIGPPVVYYPPIVQPPIVQPSPAVTPTADPGAVNTPGISTVTTSTTTVNPQVPDVEPASPDHMGMSGGSGPAPGQA